MSLKSLAIIATTILAASFGFSVASQAGCGKHRGFSKSYSYSASYKAKQRAKARARARARLAAKKKAKAKALRIAKAKAKAKAEAEAKRVAAAKTEGTFVSAQSTAALLTDGDVKKDAKEEKPNLKIAGAKTDTTEDTVVTASNDTGCTRFVPAVGRTISVDCE